MDLKVKRICESKCSLGEGLHVADGNIYWVDISEKKIWLSSPNLISKKVEETPSVIFKIDQGIIELGTDRGVLSFDFESESSTLSLWSGCVHDICKFRANDGARLGLVKIIGFMHRNNAAQNPGFVYIHSDSGLSLIDDSIHIPNLFVAVSESKVLITDSLKGCVWLYTFDNSYRVVDKELWHEYEENIFPDGGCCIGDKVFIALWGGHSVSVLDFDGIEIDRLHVNVPQPTNCKYDREANELWVTSAREGLDEASLERWPNSGDTFCFDLGGVAC